jgi:hypothetical protein
MLKATADRFEEDNDDLEAIVEGDMGFHAYFVAWKAEASLYSVGVVFYTVVYLVL